MPRPKAGATIMHRDRGMPAYFNFAIKRLWQFVLVVFIGINIAYVITHVTPIDPVEQSISAVTSFGNTSPEAIADMRRSLQELYGLKGDWIEQYISFWRRILQADFGPSLSAFPAPVTSLIARALPWTFGLLAFTTLVSWSVGNLLGALAGYYRNNRSLKFFGVLAMALHPVPYYIVALSLMIVFGFIWPVLPITGGSAMDVQQGWNWQFVASVFHHSVLPALSLIMIGIGSWFLGMRSLVSNIITEDYVVYAEIGGVAQSRMMGSYIIRNALAPQVTGLAMSLGGIFNGAVITEKIFGYPGLGTLLVDGVYAGDYGLVLGVTSIAIIGVSLSVLVIDLIYPLIDPRVQVAS
jgi:peptide/nickel transport system permease protein